MPECVRRVEQLRRCRIERVEHRAPSEEIAHERLARRSQLVCENVPWARLERAAAQSLRELVAALGTNRQVILDHDRLSIEQKRGEVLSIVEERIDERNQPLAEPADGVVPLAIPVRVAHHVDGERLICWGRHGFAKLRAHIGSGNAAR